MTDDRAFLTAHYPLIKGAAQFLGVDTALIGQLTAAIPKIQALLRTDTATQTQLLTPAQDANGTTMIGLSTQPAFEPYVEQSGVLAITVPESLATDYDGLLRIAPAWPADWTGEGTVAIGHKSKVHVQITNGSPTTVAISSGAAQQLAVRSPWPGQSVTVLDGQTRAVVVAAQSNATFTIPAQQGRTYLVEKTGATVQPFQSLSGTPATTARRYDKATIGLAKGNGAVALKARANGKYVTAGTGTPLIANRDAIGPWEQFDLIEGVA
ncbi:hypothetical protein [Kribbella italica]|uniref:Uncharacterized protein n=1 Tax=Kribbella italica TaxID=1540520 RepID=A0A7W9J1K8_9ACTN|nr:hypothetical protein [Kribbella italica]MBB5833947.1 hypothetical protein [Kribbella italica]